MCLEKLWVYKIGLCCKKISESSSFKSTQLFKTERSSSHPAICFIRIIFYNKKKYEKRSLAFLGRLFCQFTILSCQDGVPNYMRYVKHDFMLHTAPFCKFQFFSFYHKPRILCWCLTMSLNLMWVAELYSLFVLFLFPLTFCGNSFITPHSTYLITFPFDEWTC